MQGNCSSSYVTENNIDNIDATLNAYGISANHNFLGMETIFINSNNISNLTSESSIIGIYTDSLVVQINNNELTGFEASDFIVGISVDGTAQFNTDIISENKITDFNGTSNTNIVGINHSQLDDIGLGYRHISGNQISDIENLSVTGQIIALNIDNNSSTKIYNNLIYDLRAPNFNTEDELAVAAINLEGTGNSELYYNTVFLNYVSVAENNSSSVLVIQDEANITKMYNNIFVNNTDVTIGKYAIDILNITGTYSCFSENMNNNLYFTGSLDGSAKQYIYIDNSISYMTLSEYQDFIQNLTTLTTESNSISENPPFISSVEPYDLHFNIDEGTDIQNGGIRITGMYPITDDFEGKLRYGEDGYTGGGISTDIGAYEMYEPVVETTDAEDVLFSTAILQSLYFLTLCLSAFVF